MKKLLLLDADVIIDLHSLGLFEKMSKSYSLYVTQEVLAEAKFYKRRNQKKPIKLESAFQNSIKQGKVLRIQYKILT
jgi:hypothetical protein